MPYLIRAQHIFVQHRQGKSKRNAHYGCIVGV
jgi:hypothetical protein